MPLLDSVTYFFFHSLFSELPLLFHRTLCGSNQSERQPGPKHSWEGDINRSPAGRMQEINHKLFMLLS